MESYSYDVHGNLLTFNNGITTHTYLYGNSEWKDLLTAVDGVTLTCDEIGNPLTYYNGQSYGLSWTEGRKLATITTDGKNTSYLYDTNGIRVRKNNSDGSYICYINVDGKMLGEKHYSAEGELTKSLRYVYDENGSVCGYMANTDGTTWKQYYFVTNLQGDVIQVYSLIGRELVASYSYDSWGNIISATGEKAEENPFRYRGYYYDVESGFYATGSRYYDPEIGRFINEDSLIAQSSVLGNNMFAYCLNNPVNMTDTTGNLPFFAITAAIGAVAGAVIGGVTAAKNGGNVLAGIGIGAVAGGLVGASLGAVAGAVLGGSVMATTTQVAVGAVNLVSTVATGGLGAGAVYLANNISQATNNITPITQTSTAIQPYYPPNDGFYGEVHKVTLDAGTLIQRTGDLFGRFVAPAGTPSQMLSLPYDKLGQPTTILQVTQPIEVLAGRVAPWFGQIGGAIQYKLNTPLDQLIKEGIIKIFGG